MIDGTTHNEHCWSFGPKHYECALARIAQLEADLKVAQNYEDQHYKRCQQLEAALREARDLLVEWREGSAPFTQTDMWLSITAKIKGDDNV